MAKPRPRCRTLVVKNGSASSLRRTSGFIPTPESVIVTSRWLPSASRPRYVFASASESSVVRAAIRIGNAAPRAGRVFEIAGDPSVEVSYLNAAEAMTTVTKPFSGDAAWEFPPASVSVLELEV